jgi:hypothetical protein
MAIFVFEFGDTDCFGVKYTTAFAKFSPSLLTTFTLTSLAKHDMQKKHKDKIITTFGIEYPYI